MWGKTLCFLGLGPKESAAGEDEASRTAGGTGPGMNPDADHHVCVPPALEDEMGTAPALANRD